MFKTKVHLAFLVTHLTIVCVADFIIDETEEHTICIRYNGESAALKCLSVCSSDCSKIGGKRRDCTRASNIDARYCCCIKNEKIPYGECQHRCDSYGYSFSYDDVTLECKCVCSDRMCDSSCGRENKFGKCQNLKKQQPMKNPCNCYCDETCAFKFNSKYVNASCNANNNCIKTCNGTQEIGPPWCELNKDKCGCTCSKQKCETFCKDKNVYGICQSTSLCNCQYSMYTDNECKAYCKSRTGSNPISVPSATRHCNCNYRKKTLCNEKCESVNNCSGLDGCFCKDNEESITQLNKDLKKCKEQVCYRKYERSLVQKNLILVTNKPDNFFGILCLSHYVLRSSPNDFTIVPGIAIAKKKPNGELTTSKATCHLAYDDEDYAFILPLPIDILVEGNQSNFGFKKMKRNEKIPKQAMKFQASYYFGRAFAGEVLGTINDKGVMVGGNISLNRWKNQMPIRPNEFEIFVCNPPIS